jgi:hypothetical protein
VAVSELHGHLFDVERCRKLLAEQGFAGQVLREGDPCSTWLAWRP